MADENNDSIDTLITRVLSGEATPEEQRMLDDWIKTPANAAYFERTKHAFILSENHLAKEKGIPPIDVDEEWSRFSSRVAGQKDNVRKLRFLEITWVRIAAALLVVAAVSFVVNFLTSDPAETRFETMAETQRIELPDGSVVTLNRNSSLAFDNDFNTHGRIVRLTGEAFFDVAPDKQKPFVISSGAARVEVVGTTFNVSAYESDKQLTVTVETGIVRLGSSGSTESVELRSGQAGTFTKSDGRVALAASPDVNYRSWSTKHIEFSETSLQEVVNTLKKTYGANIVVTGPISDECVVTVTFDQQTLDAVLRVLEKTLNLTYRVNGDRIEITSAKC